MEEFFTLFNLEIDSTIYFYCDCPDLCANREREKISIMPQIVLYNGTDVGYSVFWSLFFTVHMQGGGGTASAACSLRPQFNKMAENKRNKPDFFGVIKIKRTTNFMPTQEEEIYSSEIPNTFVSCLILVKNFGVVAVIKSVTIRKPSSACRRNSEKFQIGLFFSISHRN